MDPIAPAVEPISSFSWKATCMHTCIYAYKRAEMRACTKKWLVKYMCTCHYRLNHWAVGDYKAYT